MKCTALWCDQPADTYCNKAGVYNGLCRSCHFARLPTAYLIEKEAAMKQRARELKTRDHSEYTQPWLRQVMCEGDERMAQILLGAARRCRDELSRRGIEPTPCQG
jgi:hypothetical protein